MAIAWFAWGKLPAVDGDLQRNVKGCSFLTIMGSTSWSFTTKFQNAAGNSVLGVSRNTHAVLGYWLSEHFLKDT